MSHATSTHVRRGRTIAVSVAALGLSIAAVGLGPGDASQVSKPFQGAKANTGTVTYTVEGGLPTLTLSEDFVVPDTPAPHWQIVDTRNNAYLLHRLVIKGDKLNRSITVPPHIESIKKVQIWCAWAETLLGETSFRKTIELPVMDEGTAMHTSSRFMGPKANQGTVSHTNLDGHSTLVLSEDFVVPDTPAPHWQLVDSQGDTYLLQRLVIKGDVYHGSIAVPEYVPDVAKVQIWCAWAETLLGEASFDRPVK